MALLLDTTVLIDALRGRAAAERIRAIRGSAEMLWISAVNAEEVLRGSRDEEEQVIGRFLAGFRIAPLGRGEGELAGRWRRDHARTGVTLSQADCLIGAAALGVGAKLATGNPRHFPMPELKVEHWPVG